MINDTKWTRPPWRVCKGWVHPSFSGPSPQTTNSDTAICEPLGPDKIANANLISAAPELYEALKFAMRFVEQVRAESPAPKGGGEDIAYKEALDALKKARGES